MLKEMLLVFRKSLFPESKQKELFAYIWQHYRKRISFYISNFIPRGHPYFEDVFQEVMLKIYRALPGLESAQAFKSWIYRICRNRCLDFLKSRGEKSRLEAEIPENAPASGDSPEEAAIRSESLDRIDRCLDGLGASDGEIAFLHFYEGLTAGEIGRIVGLKAGAVRFRIHWIIKKMKRTE